MEHTKFRYVSMHVLLLGDLLSIMRLNFKTSIILGGLDIVNLFALHEITFGTF